MAKSPGEISYGEEDGGWGGFGVASSWKVGRLRDPKNEGGLSKKAKKVKKGVKGKGILPGGFFRTSGKKNYGSRKEHDRNV